MPLPSLDEVDQILSARGVDPNAMPETPAPQPANGGGNDVADQIDQILLNRGIKPIKIAKVATGNPWITPQEKLAIEAQEYNLQHEQLGPYSQPASRALAALNPMDSNPERPDLSPIVRGVRNTAYGIGQTLAVPLNILTGEDVSGKILHQQQVEEEAYRQHFGKPTPFSERIVSGTAQGVSEILGIGATAGPTAYMTHMGIRSYDSGLGEAKEAGITGAQAHAYASVNAAADILTEYLFQRAGKGALAEATGLKAAIKSTLWKAMETGGEEATEEVLAQIMQNANKRLHGITNPDGTPVGLFDGTDEAAIVGHLTGTAVSVPGHIREGIQQAQAQPAVPAAPAPLPGQPPTQQPTQGPPNAPPQPAPQFPPTQAQTPAEGAAPPVERQPPRLTPAEEGLSGIINQTFGKEPKLTKKERRVLRDLGLNNTQIAHLGTTKAREMAQAHIKGTDQPAQVEQPATPTERPPAVIPITPHQPGAGGAPIQATPNELGPTQNEVPESHISRVMPHAAFVELTNGERKRLAAGPGREGATFAGQPREFTAEDGTILPENTIAKVFDGTGKVLWERRAAVPQAQPAPAPQPAPPAATKPATETEKTAAVAPVPVETAPQPPAAEQPKPKKEYPGKKKPKPAADIEVIESEPAPRKAYPGAPEFNLAAEPESGIFHLLDPMAHAFGLRYADEHRPILREVAKKVRQDRTIRHPENIEDFVDQLELPDPEEMGLRGLDAKRFEEMQKDIINKTVEREIGKDQPDQSERVKKILEPPLSAESPTSDLKDRLLEIAQDLMPAAELKELSEAIDPRSADPSEMVYTAREMLNDQGYRHTGTNDPLYEYEKKVDDLVQDAENRFRDEEDKAAGRVTEEEAAAQAADKTPPEVLSDFDQKIIREINADFESGKVTAKQAGSRAETVLSRTHEKFHREILNSIPLPAVRWIWAELAKFGGHFGAGIRMRDLASEVITARESERLAEEYPIPDVTKATREDYIEARFTSAANNPEDPDYKVMQSYGHSRGGFADWERGFKGKVGQEWDEANPAPPKGPDEEMPFGPIGADDELRHYGAIVDVAPQGRQEGYRGTVHRVLNGGTVVEVQREGFDTTSRVDGYRITVVEPSPYEKKSPAAPVEQIPAGGKPKLSEGLVHIIDRGRTAKPEPSKSVLDLSDLTDWQLRRLARDKEFSRKAYGGDIQTSSEVRHSVDQEMQKRGIKDYTPGPPESEALLKATSLAREAREKADSLVAGAKYKAEQALNNKWREIGQRIYKIPPGRGQVGLSGAKKYANDVQSARKAAANDKDVVAAQAYIKTTQEKAAEAKEREREAENAYQRGASKGMPAIPIGQVRYAVEGHAGAVTVKSFDPETGMYTVDRAGGEGKISAQPLLDNYESDAERRAYEELKGQIAALMKDYWTDVKAKADAIEAEASKEKYKEIRARNRTRMSDERYFQQAKERAKGIKGKIEKLRPEGSVEDTEAERVLEREVIDDIWEIEKKKNEKGETLYGLKHRPSGLYATTTTSAANAKQLLVMFRDQGIDLAGVKTEKDLSQKQIEQLRRINGAWEREDIAALNESEQQKARALGQEKPTDVKADIVLNAADLGMSKHNPGIVGATMLTGVSGGSEGSDTRNRIKEFAREVPEFAYNPVFVVTPEKKLLFRDHFQYRFDPEAFNLHPAELTVRQTVGINLEDLGIPRATEAEVVAKAFEVAGWQHVKELNEAELRVSKKKGAPLLSVKQARTEEWGISQGKDADEARQIIEKIKWTQPGQTASSEVAPTEITAPEHPKRPKKAATESYMKAAAESPILTGMKRLGKPGELVPFRDLRKETGLSKGEFDRKVLALAKGGMIALQAHDNVGSLTPKEAAELVYDPNGTSRGVGFHPKGAYYVGATLRGPEAFLKKTPQASPEVPRQAEGPPPYPAAGEPVSAHDIRRTVDHLFGIPILRGRVKARALGMFEFLKKTIRVQSKEWANLGVVTHELAHGLADKTDILSSAPASASLEAARLDYDQNRLDPEEGFAEFIRHLFTTGQAFSLAPEMYNHVEEWIKANPEYEKKFRTLGRLMSRFREQNPMDAILAEQWAGGRRAQVLQEGRMEALRDQMGSVAEDLRNRLFDETRVVKQIVETAFGPQSRESEEFNNLVDALHGTDRARNQSAWMHGVHTITGQPKKLSEGVPEILKEIKRDEKDQWETYVNAKDALSRIERVPGYNPGLPQEVYENRVAEVEADPDKAKRFEKAARGMRKFAAGLVELMVHEGGLSRASADRMLESQQDFYMPRYRIREHGLIGRLTGMVGDAKGLLPLKKVFRRMSRTGSSDAILPPLEAYARQNEEVHNAATKYAILVAFLKHVDPEMGGASGLGQFIARVDPNTIRDKVKLEGILDGLTKGVQAGNSTDVRDPLITPEEAQRIKDVTALRDGSIGKTALDRLEKEYGTRDVADLLKETKGVRDLEDAIAFYKRDYGTTPEEHIVRVMIDDKPYLYQFRQRYVWEAVMGMRNPRDATTYARFFAGLVNGWNKWITRPTKAMYVALHPTTLLGLSAIDAVTFPMQSKKTGWVERYYAPMMGIGYALGAKLHALEVGGPQAVKGFLAKGALYTALQEEEGGQIAGEKFGFGRGGKRSMIEASFTDKSGGIRWRTIPWRFLNSVSHNIAILDSGMRSAEIAAAIRQHGYKPNTKATAADISARKNQWYDPSGKLVDDLPPVVKRDAIAAGNEVLTNFKRVGYTAREIGKVVPFFTAGMAGLAKETGNIAELATGKGEAWGKRLSAVAVLATLSAGYWWLTSDDDDREDMDPNIAKRYWTFSHSGIPWAKIPKPRGYSFIPNFIEGLLDMAVKGKNPHLWEQIQTELDLISPPVKPSGATPLAEVAINRDWTWRKIEDDSMQRLAKVAREKPYTLESSKFLSQYLTQWVGLSPVQTEYLLDQYTGRQYSEYVGTIERAYRGEFEKRNTPFLSKFAARGLYQRSIGEFYDKFTELDQNVATLKYLKMPDPEREADLRQMNRFKEGLSDLRKATHDVANIDEKLDIDRYAVGLADYALGKTPRDSFPNPLARSTEDAPEKVQAVRDAYLSKLGHALTHSAGKRRIGEHFEDFMARVTEAADERKFAAMELKRLGYTPVDVERTLSKRLFAKGQHLSPQSRGEIRWAMRPGQALEPLQSP